MADQKMDFRRAFKAVRKLLSDKEDTSQVFIILEALAGRSGERTFARFLKTPHAQEILRAEHSLLEVLNDRAALAQLPAGSLGRVYYEFTEREQITADGLVEASEEGRDAVRELSDDEIRFHTRQRDQHDLWHVVTGYGRDALGELSLLTLLHSFYRNHGFLLIIFFGTINMRRHIPGIRVLGAVREGYAMARRARWLPAIYWEDLLARPLEEVRRDLGLTPPPIYAGEAARFENELSLANLAAAE